MATASQTLQFPVTQGLTAASCGRSGRSGGLYEAALAENPGDADARCLLGVVRQQQGRAAEAVGLIEMALALRPEVPGYHASLGMAFPAKNKGDIAK